jgi:ferredoxin
MLITKQEFNTLIAEVAKETTFYAPIVGENGIEYAKTSGDQPIAYTYVNVKMSPKGIFFPQQEVLCRFCGDTIQEVPVPNEPFILFGGRPCDARSLTYLDKIFEDQMSQFSDPYYVTRREQSLLITLACSEPAATCFCTSVGGNPAEATGSDILVFELGDELLFEACSDRGTQFLDTYGSFFQSPTDTHIENRQQQAAQVTEQLQELHIDDLKAKLDAIFEDAVWESMTSNCLGCGACTYLCPTCHCFDICDETDGQGEGIRLRTWDSCQYALFTKHASGHNPRVQKKQRMRQRLMHKFSYTVEKSDDIFCVGCGRCVTHCPVNLDIREMLTTLIKI